MKNRCECGAPTTKTLCLPCAAKQRKPRKPFIHEKQTWDYGSHGSAFVRRMERLYGKAKVTL